MVLQNLGNNPAERLRTARERAGYDSAAEFAKYAGVNYTTYAHHENGRREMKPEIVKLYARLLNLTPGQLLYGESSPQPSAMVPVAARVGLSGKVTNITKKDIGPDTTYLPDPMNLVAMLVCGDDLYPAYNDGDMIFHRPLRTNSIDLTQLHGLECVVQLASGELLLRRVSLQSDGRMTLMAYQLPPLLDQVVVAAAPVEIVKRRVPATLFNH